MPAAKWLTVNWLRNLNLNFTNLKIYSYYINLFLVMTTKGGQAFLLKIIEMYRDSPCLWYQGNSDFRDNAKRNIALDKILEFYKTRDPSASRDTVFKKLSNIRSSYKKEMRKVNYFF